MQNSSKTHTREPDRQRARKSENEGFRVSARFNFVREPEVRESGSWIVRELGSQGLRESGGQGL